MSFTRIVSRDEWSDVRLDSKTLQKVKILLWQDPATNQILKAYCPEREICPVIEFWKEKHR